MEKARERVILHCDCNGFFASVETLLDPALADVPMVVTGDPESRHGIILAKNEKAKKYGIQTAETIWQAKQKCPGLVCVLPHHNMYGKISKRVNAIYLDYTDLVDPFGIDESFLDVTGSLRLFKKSPRELADEIRERVKREIGITISASMAIPYSKARGSSSGIMDMFFCLPKTSQKARRINFTSSSCTYCIISCFEYFISLPTFFLFMRRLVRYIHLFVRISAVRCNNSKRIR